VRDAGEIERTVAAFARSSNSGLIVTASALAAVHRELIIALATRHKLSAVYYQRNYAAVGGLISYGPDFLDQYQRAAAYVDRILRGEKPADLPVQAPIKYELVINLRTAKALGLEVPPTLLARAESASSKSPVAQFDRVAANAEHDRNCRRRPPCCGGCETAERGDDRDLTRNQLAR
jgi:putative ABC transport system substrate-binding protein